MRARFLSKVETDQTTGTALPPDRRVAAREVSGRKGDVSKCLILLVELTRIERATS